MTEINAGAQSGDPLQTGWSARLVLFTALLVCSLLVAVSPKTAAHGPGPGSVADIAESLHDSVVNISTTQTMRGLDHVPLPNIPKGSPFEEFFKDFFDRHSRQGAPKRVNSLGSGFVLDAKGLIVTNHHVIKDADEIIVKLHTGEKLKVVEVLGRDVKSDLALLRVEPKKPLKAVKFGDSDKLRIGDWVMAVGNPFGLGGTLTVGVVSAKKRDINAGPYDEFIQTDAAINRGNSGGPLFNMQGEVVGVNTAIISPTGGSIGIGFAIPARTAVSVINQLRKYGKVRRGWLGVHIQTVSEGIAESLGMSNPKGALVASVAKGGPAEVAGLRAGDVILSFEGAEIADMRQLPKMVARTDIDAEVKLVVLRKGERKNLTVRIGLLDEANEDKLEQTPALENAEEQSMFGLTLVEPTPELRQKYKIDESVNGVLITEVQAGSPAANKDIRPGQMIVEINQTEVLSPAEVVDIVKKIKEKGRKHVLLLLSDSTGELRFVALPLEKK